MSVSCPDDLFLLCLGVSFTSRWFYLLFSSVLSLPEFCLTDFIFLGLLIFLGRLILVVSPRSSMLVSCEVICSSKIYSSNLLSSIFLRNALTNPLPFRKLISLSRVFSSPDFYPHSLSLSLSLLENIGKEVENWPEASRSEPLMVWLTEAVYSETSWMISSDILRSLYRYSSSCGVLAVGS